MRATHETPSIFGPRVRRAHQARLLTANGVGLDPFQFSTGGVGAGRNRKCRTGCQGSGISAPHWHVDDLMDRIVTAEGWRGPPALTFVSGGPWVLAYGADPWSNIVELMAHSDAEVFVNWRQPQHERGADPGPGAP